MYVHAVPPAVPRRARPFKSCRAMSCRVMTLRGHARPFMSCRVMPCHVVPCHAVPCHAVPAPSRAGAMSCRARPFKSCRVMSCHVMPCHVIHMTMRMAICIQHTMQIHRLSHRSMSYRIRRSHFCSVPPRQPCRAVGPSIALVVVHAVGSSFVLKFESVLTFVV